MDKIKNYLHRVKDIVYQNIEHSISNLAAALTTDIMPKNEVK